MLNTTGAGFRISVSFDRCNSCRGGNFAPRLQVADRIAYLTVKGQYPGDPEGGWRLVAVLRISQLFASHDEAATWYKRQNQPLPSNRSSPQRVAKDPVFLITEAEFLELDEPAQLTETQMRAVFGDIPATLNPPRIACQRLERLIQLATGKVRNCPKHPLPQSNL